AAADRRVAGAELVDADAVGVAIDDATGLRRHGVVQLTLLSDAGLAGVARHLGRAGVVAMGVGARRGRGVALGDRDLAVRHGGVLGRVGFAAVAGLRGGHGVLRTVLVDAEDVAVAGLRNISRILRAGLQR